MRLKPRIARLPRLLRIPREDDGEKAEDEGLVGGQRRRVPRLVVTAEGNTPRKFFKSSRLGGEGTALTAAAAADTPAVASATPVTKSARKPTKGKVAEEAISIFRDENAVAGTGAQEGLQTPQRVGLAAAGGGQGATAAPVTRTGRSTKKKEDPPLAG